MSCVSAWQVRTPEENAEYEPCVLRGVRWIGITYQCVWYKLSFSKKQAIWVLIFQTALCLFWIDCSDTSTLFSTLQSIASRSKKSSQVFEFSRFLRFIQCLKTENEAGLFSEFSNTRSTLNCETYWQGSERFSHKHPLWAEIETQTQWSSKTQKQPDSLRSNELVSVVWFLNTPAYVCKQHTQAHWNEKPRRISILLEVRELCKV